MRRTGATCGELGIPCLPSGAPGDGKSGLPCRARWGPRRCQGRRAVCRGALRSLACSSEGFIRGPGSGPRWGRSGACARGRPGMLRAPTEPRRRIKNRSRKEEEVGRREAASCARLGGLRTGVQGVGVLSPQGGRFKGGARTLVPGTGETNSVCRRNYFNTSAA